MDRALTGIEDLLKWIEATWATTLSHSALNETLCFCLLWNLFETFACARNANATNIKDSVNSIENAGLLDVANFADENDFFRERYLVARDGPKRFSELVQKDANVLREIAGGLTVPAKDKSTVTALLFIAYRVRNNLFHGNKGIWELSKQVDLFQNVNSVLRKYIEMLPNKPSVPK